MARAWQVLDRASTRDGVLELRQRAADDFLITQDGRVLMSSAARRSEEALGRLGVLGLESGARVLIGGLGMACTLRAALDALPERAEVVVAELHEPVVRWCRGPLAALTSGAVDDPRVRVELGDVAQVIPAGAPWHAILLDLFEGPAPSTRSRSDPHFGEAALRRCYAALTPGGRLLIWSEDPDPGFERRLAGVGFTVGRERPGRGGRRHVVYRATR